MLMLCSTLCIVLYKISNLSTELVSSLDRVQTTLIYHDQSPEKFLTPDHVQSPGPPQSSVFVLPHSLHQLSVSSILRPVPISGDYLSPNCTLPNLLKFNISFFFFLSITHKLVSILKFSRCILEQTTPGIVRNNGECDKESIYILYYVLHIERGSLGMETKIIHQGKMLNWFLVR